MTGAAAGVLLVGSAVTAAPAQAAVGCGEVTTSIALTADLTCPGDGLVVTGRTGIVIDLKGHTLRGSGGGNGVLVRSGSSGVEVRNGTITGFEYAVRLDESSGNRVWNLVLTGSRRGVDVANASGNTIDKDRITGNSGDAVKADGASSNNRLLQNTVSGNVFGLFVSGTGTGNVVAQNSVAGTRTAGIVVAGQAGGTTVSRNSVTTSGGGIAVAELASGTQLLQNTVTRNTGDGIHVDAAGSTSLGSNLATYDSGWGIYAVGPVTDLGGNEATGNGAGDCLGVVCSAP